MMSTLECSIVSGDGDGLKRRAQKPLAKRTPVPSCRRFATRQPIRDEAAKLKLEQALSKLQMPSPTSPRTTYRRKRSKTMAEITPSKRKSVEPNLDGDGVSRTPPGRDAAALRVCHSLLLNAWRRRRSQVATLTESSKRLQAQVDQLQIQVNVLQKLRESEGRRRSLSAYENQQLIQQKDELQKTLNTADEERNYLRVDVQRMTRKVEELEANGQNFKSDLNKARCDIAVAEKKFAKEKMLNDCLKMENAQLVEKLSYHEINLSQLKQANKQLQANYESTTASLDETNLNNDKLQEEKSDLMEKLKKALNDNEDSLGKLVEMQRKRANQDKKVQDLRKTVANLGEARQKLIDDNSILRQSVTNLESTLTVERARKWWKNAANSIIDSLQTAASAMLPAYQKTVDKNTSTTDIVYQDGGCYT